MLFFLHIPKAAGTSLRVALQAALGDRLVLAYPGHPTWDIELAVAAAKTLPKDAVIFGHNWWGIHDLFRQPPRYAAVLRHPVQRVISWYSWQSTHPQLQFYSAINAGMPLRHMLEADLDKDLRNHMTTFLAGNEPRGLADRETLKRAKTNLRAFQFVSISEGLAFDLPRLGAAVGARIDSLPRENATIPRAIDEATRSLILEKNALDLELYELARRIAESRNPQIRDISLRM